MKVVLIKFVDRLGRQGEVKNVSDGYARNYLLPNKFALPATAANVKKFEQVAKKKEERAAAPKFDPLGLAGQLRAVVLDFSEKADDAGTLFAGIAKDKLAAALAKRGFQIKPRQIDLDSAIKKIGEHKIYVTLASGVKSEFRVMVRSEENGKGREEA